MSIDPANAIYVGDSSVDIAAALNAGMLPVWVNRGINYVNNPNRREGIHKRIKKNLENHAKKEQDMIIISSLVDLFNLMKVNGQ